MTATGGKSDEEREIVERVEDEYQRALRAIEQAKQDALAEPTALAAAKTFLARMRRFIGI